jgi:hypothetical protein
VSVPEAPSAARPSGQKISAFSQNVGLRIARLFADLVNWRETMGANVGSIKRPAPEQIYVFGCVAHVPGLVERKLPGIR